mgnify:CR=1 FL=1
MATYEFFTSCLNVAKDKYNQLLNTPRARAGSLSGEIKELMNKVNVALNYEEISVEQAQFLLNEFKKIDFSNLAETRRANKEREKYNVGFRINR